MVSDTQYISTTQTVHGIQKSGNELDGEDNVVISRSHTGAGADVVTEFLPGKKAVFAGGSGFKALRVLKVIQEHLQVLRGFSFFD